MWSSPDNLSIVPLIDVKEPAVPVHPLAFDPRVNEIDNLLAQKRSPLTGHGLSFVSAADQHGVDPFLMVAIAGKESSVGKRACGYNAWGIANCRVRFRSYNEGIEYLARLWAPPRYGQGSWSTAKIAEGYCPSFAGCNTDKGVQDGNYFAYQIQ